ncbi:MAG: fucose isomerase [Oscillospiraceae bacterium]|nr:fucose isomerase [Oscillospiraceae bacterium]
MMKNAKIGVLCLGRYTYDVAASREIYKTAISDLRTIPNIDWEIIEEPVIEKPDAEAAAARLKAAGVDAVAIISGTFHLGHLALIIDRAVRKPVLLWAFNELPYDGGKIRLNSVCGMNLNASNLYKSGNDSFICTVSDTIDREWVDAVRMKAAIEHAHIGVAGYRADGFFNLDIDELDNFRKTGVLLDHYELSDMFSAEVSDDEIAEREEQVRAKFKCGGVSDEQVRKVARLCASTEKFLDKNKLDALAIRCWPEYANNYGIAPCAMMSLLQSDGRILSCEGDAEGAETMLACQAAGCETPYLADLSQVNFDENYALMWHCGVAPVNLWDGCCDCTLDTYFAGGRGVTAGFVMKSGKVSFVRIDSARGKTRLFITEGVAEPMDKLLSGTYAKVRFSYPVRDLVGRVTETGVAHHIVMCYGEYVNIYRKLAKIMGWEIIEP